MPDSGFRMEMSGHVTGTADAGRRTNQRAAHAAPTAQMEPNMPMARQNNDSQPVANAPICSRAILHISVQKPVGIDNVAATGFGKFGRRRVCLGFATDYAQRLRHCDITTTGGSPPWMAGSFGPGRP